MNCDNSNPCSCTYPGCTRHSKCCDCIVYHKSRNEIPGCLFTKNGEKTYDRSLKAFIKDRTSNNGAL